MWVLFSPLDQAFDKFLGTFYFGDLMVIFALEPLALSASLIEFLKKQSATKLTRRNYLG